MNIFALDKDVKLAARYHCNKHVIKMILEQCQLLSTAHRLLDGKMEIQKSKTNRNVKRWVLPNSEHDGFVYSATHINHPSAVWARDNIANYVWLAYLTKELCIEYTYRYGKVHKCAQIGLVDFFLNNAPSNISDDTTRFTYPTPAMPEYCKVPGDSIASYRRYYVNEKQRMHEWNGKVKNRDIPYWLFDQQYTLVKEAA